MTTAPASMTLRSYVELLKLRIGFMIALTAVVGYAAVAPGLDPQDLGLLFAAMVMGSSSASVFNHFYDRDIDQRMERTAGRPLAVGALSHPHRILWLAAALLVAGSLLAYLAFNWVTVVHLIGGAFFYGVVYTVWLKRRTWLNIVIGGAAGSFAVLAGAAAWDPGQWMLPLLMALFLFLWTPSHFWALAILLKDDYAKADIPMLPVLVGDARTAKAILVNTVLLAASSLLPWAFGSLGAAYGLIAAIFGVRFLWQSWDLMRQPTREAARSTFFGSMIYLLGVFAAVLVDRHLFAGGF